MLQVFLTS